MWAAIGTAPKDRDILLLYSDSDGAAVRVGRWFANKKQSYWKVRGESATWARNNAPTHWEEIGASITMLPRVMTPEPLDINLT